MPEETEIKLRWSREADEARVVLEQHGYQVSEPRGLEIDQLYDREGELRGSDRLLRLRSAGGRWLVTYKGPAERSPYKSREEIETEVGEGETFARIIEALGFRPSFRYEKYRTTLSKAGEPGVVTVDETPMGTFLELEGAADWIDATASSLGFGVKDYITASYASLYGEYRRKHPGVPQDMRF